MALRVGLEPTTYWLTASRSNQLSYRELIFCILKFTKSIPAFRQAGNLCQRTDPSFGGN